jgi:hypothetical protein
MIEFIAGLVLVFLIPSFGVFLCWFFSIRPMYKDYDEYISFHVNIKNPAIGQFNKWDDENTSDEIIINE